MRVEKVGAKYSRSVFVCSDLTNVCWIGTHGGHFANGGFKLGKVRQTSETVHHAVDRPNDTRHGSEDLGLSWANETL